MELSTALSNISVSCPPTRELSITTVIVFCLQLSLSVMTIGMNFLILKAFHEEKKLRTYPNQYILNITISDLLVGFIMVVRSTIVLNDKWIFGEVLFWVFLGVQNSILGVSVLGVIAICIDRYVATSYPLLHFKRKTKGIAHLVNFSTWVVSFLFWIPIAVIWDLVRPVKSKFKCGALTPHYATNIHASIVVGLLRLVVPFVIIATLYLRIYFRIKSSGSRQVSERFSFIGRETVDITVPSGFNDIIREKGNTFPTMSIDHDVNLKSCQDQNVDADYKESSLEPLRDQSGNREDTAVDDIGLHDPKTIAQIKQNALLEYREMPIHNAFDILETVTPTQSPRKHSGHILTPDNHKAMRTLTLITLAFFVTWVPISMNMIFINVMSVNYLFIEATRWITYMNSLINPLAYAMAQPLFRKTILGMLRISRR